MANPNQPGQGRVGQNLPSPPNASSPVSFRANVNRAKTKRWVEAKQYSYDGGDWGDEDDEEEEEEEAPAPTAVPRPPYATQRTGSSSELNSRRLSGLMLGGENESRGSPTIDSTADQQKTRGFVRPADMYKRMESTTSPQAEVPSSYFQSGGNEGLRESTNTHPEATQSTSTMGLPDIKRMSSFGTDFLGGESSTQPNTAESQEPSLQHNPSQASATSQGFTSVVHQAFDVPETPNSTTGSVARSNSDGTSVISPIITRGTHDEKTPTIPEEPAESSTPTAAANDGPALIPGHRRDMSLPDRDNSPSKQPIITEHEPPSEGQAEVSSVSPGQTQLPQEAPQEASPDTPGKDFVAPLSFGDRKQSEQFGSSGYRGSIPTIIPTPNMNDSPQDGDHDKLREEIMRSLSREGSQEPEETPKPETGDSKTESIPHQYEKYWDGQTGPSADEAPRPLLSESHPDWTSNHPLGSQDPYAAHQSSTEPSAATDEAPKKPRLGRRFSWESSSTAGEPELQVPTAAETHLPTHDENDPAARAPEAVNEQLPSYDSEGSGSQRIEKPRLSIVPPIPESSSPPVQIMGPVDGPDSENNASSNLGVGTASIDEKKLQGFRDILNLTAPNQRIKAFDKTRDQFASINTGLNNWLQITIHDSPDHADMINSSQNMSAVPRSSPNRARFPKLGSLGNLGTPKEDGTPTSASSHLRRPSGNIGTIMNKTNVEQRGKEFLHTAGTFGGKAGEAAKGLFAKGRSKFRPSGDKGQSSTSRSRSLNFNFSSESNGSQGNSSLRNSINLGSLPVFKFGQNKNESSAHTDANDERNHEPSGKRFKSTRSMDISRFQTNAEDTHSRAVSQPLPVSPNEDQLRKENARKSGLVGDLEREMIAALGLSPTNPQSDPPAQAGLESSSNKATEQLPSSKEPPPPLAKDDVASSNPQSDPPAPAGLTSPINEIVEQSPSQEELPPPPPLAKDETASVEANGSFGGKRLSKEKSLPVLPVQESDNSSSPVSTEAKSTEPPVETPETPFMSIRPVVEVEPSSPPKTPPKDAVPEDAPPPTPPKDLAPLKAGKSRHNARQPSVSTLGFEDRRKSDEADEDFNNTPPSPIEPSSSPEEADPVYGKPLPEAKTSSASLPSAEETSTGFQHMFTHRPATSAQVLDAKRKAISGLPPSTPNMQSPLRNEVRYSPATRSSMLSFGSWGRQSNNSRGTRPPTPANDLSTSAEPNSSAQNGESKMDKIKSFGKRRRASVGDLLSGIQGGFQGLQEKIQQQEPEEKEKGHQRKRTFSRISSLFTRSDSQPPEDAKTADNKPMAGGSKDKDLPVLSSTDRSWVPGSQNGRQDPGEKNLPETPSDGFNPTPRLSSESMARQRASLQFPPTASPSALASGRFYSQSQSPDNSSTARHTRVKSMPLISQPLSPIPHSDSDKSVSLNSQPDGREDRVSEEDQHANGSAQHGPSSEPVQPETSQHVTEESKEHDQPSNPALRPNPSIRSRKPLNAESTNDNLEPRNIAVSGKSNMTLSEHPHRDEAQTLSRNSEPVELALRDDSSDDIVMSPTAYPGQEWMPMQC